MGKSLKARCQGMVAAMDELREALLGVEPCEDDAERRLDRFLEAAHSAGIERSELGTEAPEVLRSAVAKAPYVAQLLIRSPRRLLRTASDPYLRREKPKAVLEAELTERLPAPGVLDDDDFATALRQFRADEMARLGFRELSMGTPLEVGRELANLADVCFDAAIRH